MWAWGLVVAAVWLAVTVVAHVLAARRLRRFLAIERRLGGLKASSLEDLEAVARYVAPGIRFRRDGDFIVAAGPWWWRVLVLRGTLGRRAAEAMGRRWRRGSGGAA